MGFSLHGVFAHEKLEAVTLPVLRCDPNTDFAAEFGCDGAVAKRIA
jgi:hypothetical protein